MPSENGISGDGDSVFVPGRFQEKAQLQDLNQRFSNYVQTMRLRREQQMNKDTVDVDERKWTDQIETQREFYEKQLLDLHNQLDLLFKEKNELGASHVKFQAISSEYEERFLSLNETILKQSDEITKLQVALSTKDAELQQAKSQLTGPRTELDMCRLERDDLKKRFAEMERRFHSEEKVKSDFQQQLAELHSRCSHEITLYQREVGGLQDRLERSRQMILELEENSRRSGQKESDVAEMLRKAREASEIELRRYMEEAEAKHNLTISEVKMRMDADTVTLTSLVEENRKLQAELNNSKTALEMAQSQFMTVESAYKVAQASLESERKGFEAQLRRMERKLQETQDLLMIKIKELTSAQEANIPLKAEIDMLKALIEEEEKRLGLEKSFSSSMMLNSTHVAGSKTTFLNGDSRRVRELKQEYTGSNVQNTSSLPARNVASVLPTTKTSLNQLKQSDSRFLSSHRLPKRPSSVPIATHGFARGFPGSSGMNLFEAPLAASSTNNVLNRKDNPSQLSHATSVTDVKSNPDDDDNDVNADDDDDDDVTIEQAIEKLDKERRNQIMKKDSLIARDDSPGLNQLPPRPDNPTPPRKLPRRPASAISCKYVPADAGQGRDYFDAMFNDLRKDTMYTRVSESNVGTDVARVTSSIHDDLANSTSSATGWLKIVDIDEGGRFVRIHNTSSTRAEDIGGFLLQQNVAGHPVAVFRFPPRTKLQPGNTATVWSSACKDGIHDPPSQYIWKQMEKWGTGPECTTILCKANGQAVAWMTSAPRVSRISKANQYQPDEKSQAAEVARMMKELHTHQDYYDQMQKRDRSAWPEPDDTYGRVSLAPFPSSYTAGPTIYSDSPAMSVPPRVIKREKVAQSPSRSLPTRTGSAPLRKYVASPIPIHHGSKPMVYNQRLATNGEAEIIDLTTQRSARSKYGFDFMTHPPKVINYDGTVRER